MFLNELSYFNYHEKKITKIKNENDFSQNIILYYENIFFKIRKNTLSAITGIIDNRFPINFILVNIV